MIFIRDVERCPYVPKDPKYTEWNRVDKERLDKLVEARTDLLTNAHSYLSHEDRIVREMAVFTIRILKRDY